MPGLPAANSEAQMHIDRTSLPHQDKIAHDPIAAALASIEDFLAALRMPAEKAAVAPLRVSAADRLVDY